RRRGRTASECFVRTRSRRRCGETRRRAARRRFLRRILRVAPSSAPANCYNMMHGDYSSTPAMHKIFTFVKARDRAALGAWGPEPPHATLATAVPGLQRYTASLEAEGADAPFDGVAEMWFDTALGDAVAMQSAAGQQLAGDLRGHASRIEQIHVVEHKF